MSAGRGISQLGSPLHHRVTIGQAQDIMIKRFDMTAVQVSDYLRRGSSHTNRKLVEIAGEIA